MSVHVNAASAWSMNAFAVERDTPIRRNSAEVGTRAADPLGSSVRVKERGTSPRATFSDELEEQNCSAYKDDGLSHINSQCRHYATPEGLDALAFT